MAVAKGSYALVIGLEREQRLAVGRLGSFDFPAGRYLYLGSGLNGLESRVRRHLRRDGAKKRHWHIDYLTAAAPVLEVWWAADGRRRECAWAGKAREWGGGIAAPGFGASDCRCRAHLLYFGGDAAGLADLRMELLAGIAEELRGVWQAGGGVPFACGGTVQPAAGR